MKISSLVATPMLILCTVYKHSGKVQIDIVNLNTTKEETHLLKNKTHQQQMMLKPLLDKVKQLELY